MRPSRGHGVIPEVLGDHRPRVWVSDLYSAQKPHPAEQWQVCLAHQLRDGQFTLEERGYDVRPTDEGPVSASLCHPQTPRPVGHVHALAVSRGPQTPAGRVLGPGPDTVTPTLEETLHGDWENLFLFLEDASIPPPTTPASRPFV